MLITRPQPRAAMRGPNARAHSHGPLRLVSMTASQSASDRSWIGPRMLIPALLIRMSARPSELSMSAASFSTSAALVTSASNAAARRPVCLVICAAASSHAARERPEIATSAPASASAVAMVRPRPRAPPVTSATRPSRRKASRMLRGLPVGSVNAALRGPRLRRGRLVPVEARRPSTVWSGSWSDPRTSCHVLRRHRRRRVSPFAADVRQHRGNLLVVQRAAERRHQPDRAFLATEQDSDRRRSRPPSRTGSPPGWRPASPCPCRPADGSRCRCPCTTRRRHRTASAVPASAA